MKSQRNYFLWMKPSSTFVHVACSVYWNTNTKLRPTNTETCLTLRRGKIQLLNIKDTLEWMSVQLNVLAADARTASPACWRWNRWYPCAASNKSPSSVSMSSTSTSFPSYWTSKTWSRASTNLWRSSDRSVQTWAASSDLEPLTKPSWQYSVMYLHNYIFSRKLSTLYILSVVVFFLLFLGLFSAWFVNRK